MSTWLRQGRFLPTNELRPRLFLQCNFPDEALCWSFRMPPVRFCPLSMNFPGSRNLSALRSGGNGNSSPHRNLTDCLRDRICMSDILPVCCIANPTCTQSSCRYRNRLRTMHRKGPIPCRLPSWHREEGFPACFPAYRLSLET